jgi:folate-binding protein YgfZ
MTSSWQTLVQQANSDIAYSKLGTTPCYMPLDALGLLSVSGEDSQPFLQNLLTNDIALLAINQSQYSGLCNPKGRLLALFLIIRTGDTAYQLIMPKALCEAISKRLGMYILRSKVTISDDSEQTICLGLTQGKNSKINLAEADFLGATDAHYRNTKLPAKVARWLIVCDKETVSDLVDALDNQGYQCQHANYWQWLDITAGIASIFTSTQEKFTPQQLNLDLTEAVNFKKGCYPGQEVVARLYYLGKPSRRLFIAQADSSLTIVAGDEVMTAEKSVAGHVVSAVQQGDSLWCLISLKLKEHSSDLVLADGKTLFLLSDLVD